ncbi:Dehydrogenase azaJ [Hyphodiscus hymeniophilus]|uniref:Dehydrogenase azaJ n=1 Tax=Hyphodiscus hymeniophilus TaxID=353542 RepID=A0A9P7AUD2_9HELO|nr:Dehydrogenase azaJ [Hyphodiscus hymeniophilus]
MLSNTAAWLTAEKATPLEVKEAPYTSPGENEILIRNGAVAINPVDWAIQARGSALFSWLKYPTILGSDIAGEVVEVGSAVTRFKVGDRVLGMATDPNEPSRRGFQTYTILESNMAAQIPDELSYEDACVIPMGISVGACGLFQKDMLALEYPTLFPNPTGKTLLIWEGYEVISTSSPENFDLVKKLGACQVFDYKSPCVIDDLIMAFKGKDCAGAVAIGDVMAMFSGVAEACIEVVSRIEGTKFVALTMPVPPNLPEGAETKFIWGTSLKDNELGKIIYEDFLPEALAKGKYVAAPQSLIVGKGLEYLQEALDVQKKGVSAKKVVVSL